MLKIITLSCLIVLVSATASFAGTLSGRVFCENGQPASNKIIRYPNGETRTDNNGFYILSLSPGRYRITINGNELSVIFYPYNSVRDFTIHC